MNLYQITGAFPTLMENEEMSVEEKAIVEKELNTLLCDKSANIIGFIRNQELMIEAKKNEENRIAESRKADERRLDNFKKYVKECMENVGILKVETELGSLSISKNPMSVEIENEDEVPDEFKQEVKTIKVDKTALKNHFKETGELVPGVRFINDKTSLRVK